MFPCTEAQILFAQDGAFDKSMKMFEKILGRMKQAVLKGQLLSELEERLPSDLHELGRSLLQEHVDPQGTGDFGAIFEYEGHVLRRMANVHDRHQ